MIENFTVTVPNSINFPRLPVIIVSFLLSFIIIYPIIGKISVASFVLFVVLFVLFYVILNSMSNNNQQNELPNTLYPSLPHLGLDGISLNNYVSGLSPQKYI